MGGVAAVAVCVAAGRPGGGAKCVASGLAAGGCLFVGRLPSAGCRLPPAACRLPVTVLLSLLRVRRAAKQRPSAVR